MRDNQFKFYADGATAFRIREAALTQNRSAADIIRRAIDRSLEAPTTIADACFVADKGQRNRNGKICAAYLSGPIAAAVRELAAAEGRSQSHIVRGLLRTELRRRGLLASLFANGRMLAMVCEPFAIGCVALFGTFGLAICRELEG
jgi:hypothetical protein